MAPEVEISCWTATSSRVLAGAKLIDLTGLINEDQIFSVVDMETEEIPSDEEIVVIAAKKK